MQTQVRPSGVRTVLLSMGLGLVVALWSALPAAAQTTETTPVPPTTKAKKTTRVKKARQVEPEPRLPGGETRAERERRLLRECKGRPNAGACSGYAS